MAAGCGGAPGEPYMGNVVVSWTGTSYPAQFGVAVNVHDQNNMPTSKMRVAMGTGPINCGATDIHYAAPDGVFVLFDLDPVTGSTTPLIQAVRALNGNLGLVGTNGSVTISSVGPPTVTGNFTFSYTGTDGPVSASGNFAVKRCF